MNIDSSTIRMVTLTTGTMLIGIQDIIAGSTALRYPMMVEHDRENERVMLASITPFAEIEPELLMVPRDAILYGPYVVQDEVCEMYLNARRMIENQTTRNAMGGDAIEDDEDEDELPPGAIVADSPFVKQ